MPHLLLKNKSYHILKTILSNTESNLLPATETHSFTLNSALEINFILALLKNSFPGSM